MVATRSGAGLIVRNPRIQGGEPTIRGTRVPVRSVAIARDRYDGDLARVARAFTIDDATVRAALAFYEANKAEIDGIIADNERVIGG